MFCRMQIFSPTYPSPWEKTRKLVRGPGAGPTPRPGPQLIQRFCRCCNPRGCPEGSTHLTSHLVSARFRLSFLSRIEPQPAWSSFKAKERVGVCAELLGGLVPQQAELLGPVQSVALPGWPPAHSWPPNGSQLTCSLIPGAPVSKQAGGKMREALSGPRMAVEGTPVGQSGSIHPLLDSENPEMASLSNSVNGVMATGTAAWGEQQVSQPLSFGEWGQKEPTLPFTGMPRIHSRTKVPELNTLGVFFHSSFFFMFSKFFFLKPYTACKISTWCSEIGLCLRPSRLPRSL